MSAGKAESGAAHDIPVDENGIPILTELVEAGVGKGRQPRLDPAEFQTLLVRLSEDLIPELADEYRRALRAALEDAVDLATERALERMQQRLQGIVAKTVRSGE